MPKYLGRLWRGIETDRMVKPPFINPEEPIPAMARPMMSIVEDCATPQMSEPTSKTKKQDRYMFYHPGLVGIMKVGLGRQAYLCAEIGVDFSGERL